MKRLVPVIISAVLIVALVCGAALSAGAQGSERAELSLRIEGRENNLYYNSALSVEYLGSPTAADALKASGIAVSESGGRVVSVGGESGTWTLRVNGSVATAALDECVLKSGDELLLYYTTEGMQYPYIDMSNMMSGGSVFFCDEDGAPIAGASVVWDGMSYTTGADGKIIIDSTGVGTPHSVQIEKYDGAGEPTVLRLAQGCTVTAGFTDVPGDSWAAEYVYYAVNSGLFAGTGGGKFSPDVIMTRAMFVTVLGRLNGASVDHSGEHGFEDVFNDGWSVGYIVWAVQNGIVNGVDATHFEPERGVTREQIAAILYRYSTKCGYDFGKPSDPLTGFTDSGDVSDYAKEAMSWAVGCGVITGSDGVLKPGEEAARAQVAAILSRFSKLIDEYGKSVIYDSVNTEELAVG